MRKLSDVETVDRFYLLPHSTRAAAALREAKMQRIVIVNPKGGSGKTTIATNLAAFFAAAEGRPTLLDLDPQGSAARWLRRRPRDLNPIHSIAGFQTAGSVTRSWLMRIPSDCTSVVVDTPAAVSSHRLPDVTRGAHAVLVPVMPSEIDIHATAKCIADLLLVAKIRRSDGRIGIVANRVRSNTRVSQSLMRFLRTLDIPLVATLRDSQNYLRSAELGAGIAEMPRWQAWPDLSEWEKLLEWLGRRREGAEQPAMPAGAVAAKALG